MALTGSQRAGSVFAALLALPAAVEAHPHVWISAKTTVTFDRGTITALQHHWTFDEFYTAAAIAGLDTNGDGIYDRQELAELAQTNIDGLKALEYFTFATLAGGKLNFDPPKDYSLEYKDGILTLHFTLPFRTPVLADAEDFSFSVYDPSFYVALGLAKDNPVSLGGDVPQGCNATVGSRGGEAANTQALVDAFSQQLGGAKPATENAVSITCPSQ